MVQVMKADVGVICANLAEAAGWRRLGSKGGGDDFGRHWRGAIRPMQIIQPTTVDVAA